MQKPENLKIVGMPDIQFIYKVMDADAVNASHIAYNGFAKNPLYAFENERRYHGEVASQNKVLENARQLDADFLLDGRVASIGAPIVDKAGNVLGGNSRAMSIQYAIDKFPARYDAYKSRVLEFASERGIIFNEIETPILVREIQEDMDKARAQALISALNEDFTASRDKRADAKSRGARFSVATLQALAAGFSELDSLRAFFDTPASLPVVARILRDGVISPLESNEYLDNQGYLRPEGKALVESALRSRVFNSYEALARISAPMLGKIDGVVPYLVITDQIPTWSVTPLFTRAVDLYLEYVNNDQKDREVFLNQTQFMNTAPRLRYSALEIDLFFKLQDMPKMKFIGIFKEYAYHASISAESGGFGIGGLSRDAAFAKYFAVSENAETIETVQNPVNVAADCQPETQEAETPKKTRKPRERKNDCDKQNSAFIIARNDRDELVSVIQSEVFYNDVELVANSKSQFRVRVNGTEIDGYRVIRSGRQWQLRLLNGYDAFIFESIDSNSDASEIYEDAEIQEEETTPETKARKRRKRRRRLKAPKT